MDGLRREVRGLGSQHADAKARLSREQKAVDAAAEQVTKAGNAAGEAEGKVRAASADLVTVAHTAGLADSVRRHLPDRDVDALVADHAGRAERFTRLRELHTEHGSAERKADKSALAVERAQNTLDTARAEENTARTSVEDNLETLRQQVRDWAATPGSRGARRPWRRTGVTWPSS